MTNVQVFFVAITMGAAITAIFKSSEASMNALGILGLHQRKG